MKIEVKAEHVNAFLGAAFEVLGERVEAQPHRGSPMLRSGRTRSVRELTAVVQLTGDLVGVLFYGMSQSTAQKLRQASLRITGSAPEGEGEMVTELIGVMASGGVDALRQQGLTLEAGDVALITGAGHDLTDLSRILVLPLLTEHGDIDIGIGLVPAAAAATLSHETSATRFAPLDSADQAAT